MAYLNINNMCIFEGRLVKDPELSSIQSNNNSISKVKFTMALDKNMTKDQKDKATKNDQPTADFINCECIGPKANFISDWFNKGDGIRIVASFRSYSYTDKEGTKKSGYAFDVVDASFPVGKSNGSGGNNLQTKQQTNSFQPIDDDDLPF